MCIIQDSLFSQKYTLDAVDLRQPSLYPEIETITTPDCVPPNVEKNHIMPNYIDKLIKIENILEEIKQELISIKTQ